MMRVLATLCIFSIAMPVEAASISRHKQMEMTCDEAQAAVKSDGAIVMMRESSKVPGLMLYNRYVSGRHMCGGGELTRSGNMKTSDSASCKMKTCVIQGQKAGGVKRGTTSPPQ